MKATFIVMSSSDTKKFLGTFFFTDKSRVIFLTRVLLGKV